MQVTPHLDFEGRCEEAIEFYCSAIGAEVEALVRFRDMPADAREPGVEGCASGAVFAEDKILHAAVRIGESRVLMTDGRNQGGASFAGIALSLDTRDEAHAAEVFAALSAQGQVQMPLAQTFFASRFGMLADRFGVTWMVLAQPVSPS